MSKKCRVDYDGESTQRIQVLLTPSLVDQINQAIAAGKACNRSHLARLAIRAWLDNTDPVGE